MSHHASDHGLQYVPANYLSQFNYPWYLSTEHMKLEATTIFMHGNSFWKWLPFFSEQIILRTIVITLITFNATLLNGLTMQPQLMMLTSQRWQNKNGSMTCVVDKSCLGIVTGWSYFPSALYGNGSDLGWIILTCIFSVRALVHFCLYMWACV